MMAGPSLLTDTIIQERMDDIQLYRKNISSIEGWRDSVCNFASGGCPGAKEGETFRLRCADAKKQYDFRSASSCSYNVTSKGRGYLVQ